MVVNGVRVDFVGEYEYPYFLRKFKGYVVKVVSSVGDEEIEESLRISKVGYLPIYILKCTSPSYIKNIIETEKKQFNFNYAKVEIERSILDINRFKGLILVSLGESRLVCCNDYSDYDSSNIVVKGFLGNLKDIIYSSLSIYNRRIVEL